MSKAVVGTLVAPSRLGLFTAFLKIGLLGFGGVAALARHVLVVERRFMESKDFAESFGLASSLPGANTVNLAAMLGDRYHGLSGSMVALLGLIGAPLIALVALAATYTQFGENADFQAGLYGAAAAAAGLVLGTSVKMLRDLAPDIFTISLSAAVCLGAAIKVPMPLVLLIAGPISIACKLGRQRA